MGWKNWGYWLKGGLIGLAVVILLVLFDIIERLFEIGLIYRLIFVLSFPLIYLGMLFFDCSGESCFGLIVPYSYIGLLIEGVIVGIVVGFIVGKIKSNNKTKE